MMLRDTRIGLVLAGLLLFISAALAQPSDFAFPTTPAGSAARLYLETYNALDADKLRAYVGESMSDEMLKAVPVPQLVQFHQQCWAQLGKLTPKTVLSQRDAAIAIALSAEKGGQWLKLDLTVDAGPPHKIAGLTIRPTTAPGTPERKYENWKNLAELLTQAGPDSEAPGLAVAVVRGGRVVDQAVWGARQAGKNDDPIRIADAFHLGSVTKSITATMIAALIERGVLRWDLTLAEALPDVPMRDAYRAVTLEQLLSHRGGIVPHLTFGPEDMNRFVGLPGSPTEQRGAYVREVLQLEPIGPAGVESRYSNAGYAVAGYIAERAAKKEWSELVREAVFGPLRLGTAGFGWPATAARPEQPRGHFGEGSTARVQGLAEYPLGAFIAPAGDVHASIGDFARYAAAHLEGLREKPRPPTTSGAEKALLKPETIQRLHTPPGGQAGYAAGWVIEDEPSGPVHWHNGSAGTFYSLVVLYPADDLAVVVAMNAAPGGGESLARRIADAVRAEKR